ncbi:hypothetical protein L2E82_32080 [Cichorium intybus]|uniref:Uncharacterized protein n=1 Tax=Cichorium intybus TaxID=13427 RepID=A0ACB9BH13_CICIN|nr:hypothetical protein L2E82_32080 [Cichorium intybus]
MTARRSSSKEKFKRFLLPHLRKFTSAIPLPPPAAGGGNAICLPIGTSAAHLRCFRRLGIAGCIRPAACSPPLLLTLLCFSRCCSDKVTKNA